jgi:predicted RNA-binding Zn-ribbon protein involved in translation (DUF1610 family)
MSNNRKYAKSGEKSNRYECTKRKCKWTGTMEEKVWKKVDDVMDELTCPNCGNSGFYMLSENYKAQSPCS